MLPVAVQRLPVVADAGEHWAGGGVENEGPYGHGVPGFAPASGAHVKAAGGTGSNGAVRRALVAVHDVLGVVRHSLLAQVAEPVGIASGLARDADQAVPLPAVEGQSRRHSSRKLGRHVGARGHALLLRGEGNGGGGDRSRRLGLEVERRCLRNLGARRVEALEHGQCRGSRGLCRMLELELGIRCRGLKTLRGESRRGVRLGGPIGCNLAERGADGWLRLSLRKWSKRRLKLTISRVIGEGIGGQEVCVAGRFGGRELRLSAGGARSARLRGRICKHRVSVDCSSSLSGCA